VRSHLQEIDKFSFKTGEGHLLSRSNCSGFPKLRNGFFSKSPVATADTIWGFSAPSVVLVLFTSRVSFHSSVGIAGA